MGSQAAANPMSIDYIGPWTLQTITPPSLIKIGHIEEIDLNLSAITSQNKNGAKSVPG